MKLLANREVAGLEEVDEFEDERGTAGPENGACGGERPFACGGCNPCALNAFCCSGAGGILLVPGDDDARD